MFLPLFKTKNYCSQKTLFAGECKESIETLRFLLTRNGGTMIKSYALFTLTKGSIARRVAVTDNKNKDTRNLKGDGR